MLKIYTDGSCLRNPGPGGWAFVALQNGRVIAADCGGFAATTNNQMEIFAVLAALETLPDAGALELFSDSSYVINAISKWLAGWAKCDFKGKKNPDLWRRYLALSAGKKVHAHWVKAHAGDVYNELCDELARGCASGQMAAAKAKCAALVAASGDASAACGSAATPEAAASAAPATTEKPATAEKPAACKSEKSGKKFSSGEQMTLNFELNRNFTPQIAKKIAPLENKLGYEFQSEYLITRALRHKSVGKLNNERLEFLGDAVMDLAVAQLLFTDEASYSEGELSKIRAALVNEKSFAKIAGYLQLGPLLELSAAEERGGGRAKPSLLSDAFEAIMGVIYLEAGFERACKIALELVRANFERIGVELVKDYKTKLQELTQSRFGTTPEYAVLSSSGPDHAKSFTVGVYLCEQLRAQADGRSKKAAEQAAAEKLYAILLDE